MLVGGGRGERGSMLGCRAPSEDQGRQGLAKMPPFPSSHFPFWLFSHTSHLQTCQPRRRMALGSSILTAGGLGVAPEPDRK